MSSLFKKAKEKTSKEKPRVGSGSSIHSFNPKNPLDAPKEVAQATAAYSAKRAGELSFKKGDFFYVINSVPTPDGCIEIYDPTKGQKGRAPNHHFKFFEKTHNQGNETGSKSNSRTTSSGSSPNMQQRVISQGSNSQSHTIPAVPVAHVATLFGIVLYDFRAERSDELSVKTGEKIIICAHHDFEWYIAKFVDKIGEVGLVPVSYVQLIDTVTKIPFKEEPSDVILREGLPTIDQWKAIKNKHKASARPVGEAIRDQLSRNSSQKTNPHSFGKTSKHASNIFEISNIHATNANIESFTSTNNKFWFLVRVTMSDGSVKSLCRYYEDFFNYHQKLLSAWPREGGKFDGKDRKDRILPYIPGPVIDVNESLCHKRMIDLNEYLQSLLKLPDYISKSSLVVSFFDLMGGDQLANDSNHSPAQPTRAAPNLKILNSDQQAPPISHQYQQQQQQQQQQQAANDRYSQSHQDRLSQYEPKRSSLSSKVNNLNSNGSNSIDSPRYSSRSSSQNHEADLFNGSNTAGGAAKHPVTLDASVKLKLKFYYKDEIFALGVPGNITLNDLKKAAIAKIDEAEDPNINAKIKILPKNDTNINESSYNELQAFVTDSDLWESPSFIDKGKFLLVV